MSKKLHPSIQTHLSLAREQLPDGAHVDAAAAFQDFVTASEALLTQIAALQAEHAPDRAASVGPYLNRAASSVLETAREISDAYRLIRNGSPSDEL